jgi:hypothetical protein
MCSLKEERCKGTNYFIKNEGNAVCVNTICVYFNTLR